MMKMKSKIVAALCAAVSVVSLSGCQKAPKQTVLTLEVTEASKQLYAQMYPVAVMNSLTHEQEVAQFQQSVAALAGRGEQVLPNVTLENTVEKTEKALGNVYTFKNDTAENIVLYIHGGSFMYEIDPAHVQFCDKMVDALHAEVVVPLYPLAPEATHRETYQMVVDLYRELLTQEKPIMVMGDSAGATIALGLVHMLKEAGEKLPEKVVVMAPCADATFSNPEMEAVQAKDGMLNLYACAAATELWAGGDDLSLPELSPLNGDYKNFPDTMLFIGTEDILSVDDLKLHEKMVQAGMNVTLVQGNGLWHVYPVFPIAEQAQCIAWIQDFCLEK